MTKDLLDTVFSPVKIFCHDRMFKWQQGEKIYPITVEIGISGPGNCNNRCSFCMHRHYYDDKAMMSFGFYSSIALELFELDVKGIIFSASGEPLVNPEFIDIIEYTKRLGIDVAVITNGTALEKPDIIDAIVNNASWMRVSLDAGTPATRKKIHGIDDFDDVLNSLKILAERNKSTDIGAQIVVTKENWTEIITAVEKVKPTGINYFQIKPVVFHPSDNANQLSPEFWEQVLAIANVAKYQFEDEYFKVHVKYDQFGAIMKSDHDKSAYSVCRADFFPIIEATGKVYHCSQTRGMPEFEIGDLSKETFREIWHGREREAILNCIDVEKCQPVCRCHWLNKMLKTIDLKENAPSFV